MPQRPDNGRLHTDQNKFPRMSILRRTSNSPLKLAAELKTHLPVVIQPSFVSVRSSITNSHCDQVKRRLSDLLEKGVDVVSDEKIDVSYEEEEAEEEEEEDSLVEDSSASKGIQKDWKLNDEIFERAVQTGISETLNDIVETACQTSNNRQSLDGGSNGHWRSR